MNKGIPPLQLLPAFESAARLLSFKLAAEELNLTASAVSHQIKQLEQWMGEPLFLRKTRHIELTQMGSEYYVLVAQTLNQYKAGYAKIHKNHSATTYRISSVTQIAYDVLIPNLPDFQKNNPDIELRIETNEYVVDLERERLDIAVRIGRGDWPGVVSVKLAPMSVVVVASPLLIKKRKPLKIPELLNYPLIHFRSTPNDWQRAADSAGIDISSTKQLFFENSFSALTAVENGLGIALAMMPISETRLESKKLMQIVESDFPVDEGYYFVYPEAKDEDVNIQRIQDWLLGCFN